MERRKDPRLDLNIPINLGIHQWTGEGSFQGQLIEGYLIDLSENGIRLLMTTPLAVDMFVVIHMPEEADIPLINGRIIRCDVVDERFEYGCMLLGTPIYIRNQLESYIQSQLNKIS
jgi:hypothetical protein